MALVVLAAAACSDGPVVSDSAATQWLTARAAAMSEGELGLMQARIETAGDEPVDDQATVELSYDVPARVDAVLVECLGSGTVDVTVVVRTDAGGGITQTAATTYPEQACDGAAHEITLDLDAVTALGMTVTGDQAGAWSARVLGALPD